MSTFILAIVVTFIDEAFFLSTNPFLIKLLEELELNRLDILVVKIRICNIIKSVL